jgi:hypothetical protein
LFSVVPASYVVSACPPTFFRSKRKMFRHDVSTDAKVYSSRSLGVGGLIRNLDDADRVARGQNDSVCMTKEPLGDPTLTMSGATNITSPTVTTLFSSYWSLDATENIANVTSDDKFPSHGKDPLIPVEMNDIDDDVVLDGDEGAEYAVAFSSTNANNNNTMIANVSSSHHLSSRHSTVSSITSGGGGSDGDSGNDSTLSRVRESYESLLSFNEDDYNERRVRTLGGEPSLLGESVEQMGIDQMWKELTDQERDGVLQNLDDTMLIRHFRGEKVRNMITQSRYSSEIVHSTRGRAL